MRALVLVLVLSACNGDDTDTQPPPDTGDTGDTDSWEGPCRRPTGEIPPEASVQSWDDGEAAADIDATGWGYSGYYGSYTIAEEVLHEAVRFELEHPACVYGFTVRWSDPDLAPDGELTAGLYPDFGHNGFDFWHWDPYWTGTVHLDSLDDDGWATYVLDEPLYVEHPGLVYVAHHREHDALPSWSMDGSYAGEGDCAHWDDCHSSVNNPEVETGSMYPGWTFPIPYDFLARLHYEYPEELAPEDRFFQPTDLSISSRAAWGDYDHDGWDDLYTNGALYRNLGDGTFEDVTDTSGITALGISSSGGVWGDYDNDGCLDLFVMADSYSAVDSLLHSNCDGTFSDATSTSGITDWQDYNDCGDPGNVHAPTTAAAWWDIDADGLLDLYMANMICWSDWTFYRDNVWHNLGDGTFEDWTGEHGFLSSTLSGRGASPVDADGDGDVDLLVNNYTLHRNLYFDNQGDGTVAETGTRVGLAGHSDHAGGVTYYYGHTIGAAWGDLDGDGDWDSVQANLAHPRFFDFSDKTQVLLQDEPGAWSDIAGDWELPRSEAGLRYQETHSVPVLADFDNDGALDLVITSVYDGRPTDFYWGAGDGTFVPGWWRAGLTTENGWGAAASDYDRDGDPDVVAYTLFENTRDDPGHWLQVRVLGGPVSNAAAVGATVRVHAGDRVFLRHVPGGSGQGCQDSMYLHVGLGEADQVDRIEVTYPGGLDVTYDGPIDADQRVWLFEDGTVDTGWDWPTDEL